MKKLYFFLLTLFLQLGGVAYAQAPTRLTSDQLNGITGSKRIAINLAHEAARFEFITTTGKVKQETFDKTFATEFTEFPANFVYAWESKGDNRFALKSLANEKYINTGWSGDGNYVTDISNAASFFTVKPIKGGSGNTATILDANLVYDGRDTDTPYWVRFCNSETSWINANTGAFNSGTGAWTVFYVLDLDSYYKVTLNLVKDGHTSQEVKYVKLGAEISAPEYEGYVNDYTTVTKNNDDAQTITINYTKKHSLTIGDSQWSTIFLDFNAAIPANATVYGVTVNAQGDNALLTPVSGVIAANKGYLVKGEPNSYDFRESNDDVSTVESVLKGSVTDSYFSEEAYVLAKGTDGVVSFYKAAHNLDESGNVGHTHFKNNAFKAYLPASAVPTSAGVNALRFVFDDEATAIESLLGEQQQGAIYDLSGRRVQKAQKGIYIINGKKVVK